MFKPTVTLWEGLQGAQSYRCSGPGVVQSAKQESRKKLAGVDRLVKSGHARTHVFFVIRSVEFFRGQGLLKQSWKGARKYS